MKYFWKGFVRNESPPAGGFSSKNGVNEELSCTEINLIELIGGNNNCSVTDIAKIKKVTKGAISQILKRLDDKKIIFKQQDPENLSRLNVKLTDKGNEILQDHLKWHNEIDGGLKEYFNSLSNEQINFVYQLLERTEQFLIQVIKSGK